MRSALSITSSDNAIKIDDSILGPEFQFDSVHDIQEGFRLIKKKRYDLLFLDLALLTPSLSAENHAGVLKPFRKDQPSLEIVIITPHQNVRQAVKFLTAGARDYLTYPLDMAEVKLVVDNIAAQVRKQTELEYLRHQVLDTDHTDVIQTKNAEMQAVFNKVSSVAPTKTTVLINGDTGTGKGVIARLIHQNSSRKDKQFISVHCGAIPDNLLESELFGHEKGAFTGASRKKMGKFEIACGGTIFLDEIGTLTPAAQIKLLQVLQDGTFNRVGGEQSLKSDARIIAATNADLKKMSADGLFRSDLFYRLNVFPISVPPLKARRADIPLLVEALLKKLNQQMQKQINGVRPQVMQALLAYDWPGNIRELENLLERAYILESADTLTTDAFPAEIFEGGFVPTTIPAKANQPLAEARKQVVENFERQYLKSLLSRNKGKISTSAQEAGISTRQLHKLMTRHGIQKEDFRA